MLLIRYSPAALVVVVYFTPVARFVAVTLAFATTASVGSVTTPTMILSVACACKLPTQASAKMVTSAMDASEVQSRVLILSPLVGTSSEIRSVPTCLKHRFQSRIRIFIDTLLYVCELTNRRPVLPSEWADVDRDSNGELWASRLRLLAVLTKRTWCVGEIASPPTVRRGFTLQFRYKRP